MKKSIPIPAAIGVIAVVLAIAGFLWFRTTMVAPERQAPSSTDMYSRVDKLAQQSGGDYTKLSPTDQKFLDVMSHGHGPKLLKSAYDRLTSPRGSAN